MKLSYMAKEIIKQCSDYIRKKDWQNFYGAIYQNDEWKSFCGDVTDALLAAGINPLEGLDYVPDYFLYDSKNITRFDIPDGIDEMNKNIVALNDGKFHQPIQKVRVYEKADKFAVGAKGNKATKFVEAAKGTNLYFAVYEAEVVNEGTGKVSKKRSYATIPLSVVT